MLAGTNINKIYSRIQRQLFYMIPEKWDSIYLHASVTEKFNHLQSGEMFFYYFPKSILRKNPINSYEIPSKFNLDEEGYLKLAENLYNLIKMLKQEFQDNGEEPWTNITIKVEKFHFIVEFYYDNWTGKEDEYHLIWSYKNLKIPLETYSKNERKLILKYIENEKKMPRKHYTYSEPMYQNPIKNVIQYNRDVPEFVSQEELDKIKQKEYNIEYNKKKSNLQRKAKTVKEDEKFKKFRKVKSNADLVHNKETIIENKELKLEEQINEQLNSVKSQILNHK